MTDFEVGMPILCNQREYIIMEVIGNRTIRVAVGELDLGGKEMIKKYMKKYPDDLPLCIAKWFIIQKRLTHSGYKSVRQAVPEKSKKIIEELIRLDGLEPRDVIDILHFALIDEFWKDQLFVITTLRSRKGGKLMRWEIIRKSLTYARKNGKF